MKARKRPPKAEEPTHRRHWCMACGRSVKVGTNFTQRDWVPSCHGHEMTAIHPDLWHDSVSAKARAVAADNERRRQGAQ